MSYQFRDIEEPTFTLKSGSLYAILLLLLFIFLADQTQIFSMQISEEELQALQEAKKELERDLYFRFVESPEDEVEPDEDAAYSDLTRIAKSMTNEELEPENDDPFSKGDTFELKQRNEPEPVDMSQPAQPLNREQVPPQLRPPVQPEEPQPIESEEKAQEETDTERETVREVEETGSVPTWAGAPKPYRPPTKEELQLAQEAAKQAMAKETHFRNQNLAREMRQHDNIQGRAMPNIGFSVDTAGHDLGPYLKHFIQLVKGNWRIPNIARLEAAGVSVIEFQLHQDGSITKATILSESGFEALDISSLNAILNTHPAPPLPDHIDEPFIPIKFAFYYNIRPPR